MQYVEVEIQIMNSSLVHFIDGYTKNWNQNLLYFFGM